MHAPLKTKPTSMTIRDKSNPYVVVDGCQFDLSNLITTDQDCSESYKRVSRPQLHRIASTDSAIYPCASDLPESLNVDELFDKLHASRMLGNSDTNNRTRSPRSRLRSSSPDEVKYRNRLSRELSLQDDYVRNCYNDDDYKPLDDYERRREEFRRSNSYRRRSHSPEDDYLKDEDHKRCDSFSSDKDEKGRTIVEVLPGEFVPLRGSVETWEAVQAGEVTETICICCQLVLVCIEDADLVMCPGCRVISAVDGGGGGGGLGLGMSVKDAHRELSIRRSRAGHFHPR
jgi:hypothetical protein